MRHTPGFRFKPYSPKAKKLLTWWLRPSPYAGWDGVIAEGAIRSSKTITMIDGFIEWSRQSFHGENFIVSGKTMGALKRNVISPMRQILTAKGIPHYYHRTDHFIEMGGNVYYFFGANTEAAQDVLQGVTAAGWLADEAALHPQNFIEQAIGRCSVTGSKIWLNCNPEGPYHYVKTDLIDQAVEKRLLHLHFDLDDNLTLSEQTKERYRRMYSGVWYKRFILGLWVAAEGAIYDMLDTTLHVVAAAALPAMRDHVVGVDYGTGSVTTFWLLGIGTDQKLYFLDRWRWDSRTRQQKTDVQLADELIGFLNGAGVTPKYIFVPNDALSFLLELQRRRHPRLRGLTRADQSPHSVTNGIRNVSSLLGAGRLLFSERVQAAGGLEEWTGYVWDPKAQKHGEDKPLKANDHDPDAGRYAVHGIRSIWRPWLGLNTDKD